MTELLKEHSNLTKEKAIKWVVKYLKVKQDLAEKVANEVFLEK